MSELSDQYSCEKIGFALDISDFNDMFQNTYTLNLNIYDWEIQFWQNKINNPTYELYNSAIDTTFCLINKNYIYNNFNLNIFLFILRV